MYITVAGIKRSGSTWLANAIRFYCLEAGLTVWMGEDLEGKAKEDYDVTINKLHPYIYEVDEASDYIFTSYRAPHEIRESWKRFQGSYPSDELFDKWIRWLLLWQGESDWCMEYEFLSSLEGRRAIVVIVDRVLQLKPRPDLSVVLERLEEMKPPEEGYDPETCLFANHITSEDA